MKATQLRKGDQVRLRRRAMRFLERDERGSYVFECEDYIGLNGLDDRGIVSMSARQFAAMGAQREQVEISR